MSVSNMDPKNSAPTNEPTSAQLDKNILRRDNEEYKIVKKLPKRFPTRFNDIYITNKTDFKAQIEKIDHILLNEIVKTKNEQVGVILHAMGSAINR
jgi:hypothetical protein